MARIHAGISISLTVRRVRRRARTDRRFRTSGIASWWGPKSGSDARFPSQLRAADGTNFRWALTTNQAVVRRRGSGPTSYISQRYAHDRNYLRVGGKPVIFVWLGDPTIAA